MASAPEPKKYLLKGFSDVLDGRFIRFVGQLPDGLPVCSLCSVVPFEYYSLSCKHVYCGPCFLESVKMVSTTLRCPMDGRLLRLRRAVLMATTDFDVLRRLVACCCNKDYGCSYTGALEDMQVHVRDCYVVTCSLCSRNLLRSHLVSHLEAAHSATTKSTSRNVKRREEAVLPSAEGSSGALVEKGNGEAEPEGAMTGEKPSSTPSGTTITQLSHERVLELIEATATRTASMAAREVKQVNGTALRDIFAAVEMINYRLTQHERLTTVARASSVAFTGSSRAEDAAHASVVERPRKQEHIDEYAWTVSQYSKLRVGIHYVVSPQFVITPGYRVQLTICIDGITLVELSASVKVHRGDDSQPLAWPFRRTCLFTLFDKSGNGAHVTRLFTPKDLFNRAITASPSTEGEGWIVSGWVTVSKMTRYTFERDYIENDGFTIAFSTKPSL